jgi:4-carboxymuconolactone decarboxylase
VDVSRQLRLLALRDEAYFTLIAEDERGNAVAAGIDARTCALVRLAALIVLDGAVPSYLHTVDRALAAGATPSEIVGVAIAVIPIAGSDRAVTAAPKLGLALGYDVEADLEAH